MRKFNFILLTAIIVIFVIGNMHIYAAGKRNMHNMVCEVTGVVDGKISNQTCVNETVMLRIRDLNTDRPLDRVYIDVYYDRKKIADLVTNDTGEAQFIPERNGNYKIILEKSRYNDERVWVDISACVTTTTTTTTTSTTTSTTPSTTTTTTPTTTTTTSTTTSTTPSTTTTTTPTTTTSTTTITTTIPKETCSDGIQNQGEEQVDCGGPCEPCPLGDIVWLVLAIVMVGGICVIIVFVKGGGKKEKRIDVGKIDKRDESELKEVDNAVTEVRKKKHHKRDRVKKQDIERVEEGDGEEEWEVEDKEELQYVERGKEKIKKEAGDKKGKEAKKKETKKEKGKEVHDKEKKEKEGVAVDKRKAKSSRRKRKAETHRKEDEPVEKEKKDTSPFYYMYFNK